MHSERKQKDGNVISEKRKLVDKKTTLMKRKKEEEIKCINALNKAADNMYIKAEEKWNFDPLTKTNSFRKYSRTNRKFKMTLTILSRKWNNQKKTKANPYICQDSYFFCL